MSTVPVTPLVIRVLSGQAGFCRFRLVGGNEVRCELRSRGKTRSQLVGYVTDAQRLIDFCRRESIEIEDDRTPYMLWADDPWVAYGA